MTSKNDGDGAGAVEMCLPMSLSGLVIEGDRRGRELGFPTANVAVGLPCPSGVFAGIYCRPDGPAYKAAISIGSRPTFYPDADAPLVEAHLLDFDGDLYGERAQIRLVVRLRGQRRFSGVDDLCSQLRRDVDRCRKLLVSPALVDQHMSVRGL